MTNQTVLVGKTVPKPALLQLFEKMEKKVVSTKFLGLHK